MNKSINGGFVPWADGERQANTFILHTGFIRITLTAITKKPNISVS